MNMDNWMRPDAHFPTPRMPSETYIVVRNSTQNNKYYGIRDYTNHNRLPEAIDALYQLRGEDPRCPNSVIKVVTGNIDEWYVGHTKYVSEAAANNVVAAIRSTPRRDNPTQADISVDDIDGMTNYRIGKYVTQNFWAALDAVYLDRGESALRPNSVVTLRNGRDKMEYYVGDRCFVSMTGALRALEEIRTRYRNEAVRHPNQVPVNTSSILEAQGQAAEDLRRRTQQRPPLSDAAQEAINLAVANGNHSLARGIRLGYVEIPESILEARRQVESENAAIQWGLEQARENPDNVWDLDDETENHIEVNARAIRPGESLATPPYWDRHAEAVASYEDEENFYQPDSDTEEERIEREVQRRLAQQQQQQQHEPPAQPDVDISKPAERQYNFEP